LCLIRARPASSADRGHVQRVSRKVLTLPQSPTTCSSQTQTTTTTTTFRMDLILEAIGIYRLIKYNPTPITINVTTRFNKGILFHLERLDMQSIALSFRA